MKQAIGILMEIDLIRFWAILFLHSYEEEFMSSLIPSDKINAKQNIFTPQSASLMIFAL